jgi:hypothetical protein
MYVPAVRNRLIALMTALANRFDDHPALESVMFTESALGTPVVAPATFSKDAWCNGVVDAFAGMRPAFRKTQLCQWINDRQNSAIFMPSFRQLGIGIGVTDTCPFEANFNFRDDYPGTTTKAGSFQICQEHSGIAMVLTHFSSPAIYGTVADRCQESKTIQGATYPAFPGPAYTRQQLRDFAVNMLGATHLLWLHVTSNHPAAGSKDPLIPASCAANVGAWQSVSDGITGLYNGKQVNLATDNWIHAPSSNISAITKRYVGW